MEFVVRAMRSDYRTGVKDGNPWTIDKKILTCEVEDNSPRVRMDKLRRNAFGPSFETIELNNDFNNVVFVKEGLPVSSFYDLEGCRILVYRNPDRPERIDCIEVVGIDGVEVGE